MPRNALEVAVLIILIEALVITFILRNRQSKSTSCLFVAGIAFQLLLLFLYRAELSMIGREVYWSDAEYYWNYTLAFLDGRVGGVAYNIGYVYYCVALMLTSFSRNPVLINLSNLLLLDLSILILVSISQREPVKDSGKNLFIILTMFNPLIAYSLFRNLKDVVFLFLSVLTIFLFSSIRDMRTKVVFRILLSAVATFFMSVIITTIRPWGFIIPITFLPLLLLEFPIRKSLLFFLVFLSVLFGLLLAFGRYSNTLNLWVPIVLENSKDYSLSSTPGGLIAAAAKMLVGPGPVRSALGSEYFWYSTRTGNFASFVGSLIWWVSFPFLITVFLFGKSQLASFKFIMFLILEILAIYSMAYGGSAELRFRGVLYTLLSSVLLFKANISVDEFYRRIPIYSLLLLAIVGGGIIFGL